MTDDETWVDADHANTLNAFDVGDTRTTHAVVEQASTLQGGSKGSRGHRNDAEGAAGGHLVVEGATQVIPFDTNFSNQASPGGSTSPTLDTRGTHGVAHVGQQEVAGTLDAHYYKGPGSRQGGEREYIGEIGNNRMTVRRLTPVECERLMGWPDEWTAPEGVKASDSKRYAACGDGIVAPVAFWIADRIRMIEEEEAS